jgi:Zn-dependent protease
MFGGLFISYLESNPQYWVMWVVVVILSIVAHEMAHGWAAIRRGDDTPIRQERMTPNPLVHMGPYSLAVLAILGIAWGSMPINPARIRGRYGQAFVAAAGPASNLLISLVFLTALGVVLGLNPGIDPYANGYVLLILIAGMANAMLFVFNLLPIPPLDGSTILADFHQGYARLLSDPSKQQVFLFAFLGVFILAGVLFGFVQQLAANYATLIASLVQAAGG